MNARVPNIDAHELPELGKGQFVYHWDFDDGDQPLLTCILEYHPDESDRRNLRVHYATLLGVYAGGTNIVNLLDGDYTKRIEEMAIRDLEKQMKDERDDY